MTNEGIFWGAFWVFIGAAVGGVLVMIFSLRAGGALVVAAGVALMILLGCDYLCERLGLK